MTKIYLSLCATVITLMATSLSYAESAIQMENSTQKVQKTIDVSNLITNKINNQNKRAKNFSQTGTASWYGPGFHGKRTSSGEKFDMNALTAAHPSLPIPSYARVTNLHNGKSIVVRINDRGPFHSRRVMDMSKGAAMKLGFVARGSANVLIEAVGADGAMLQKTSETEMVLNPKQETI